MKKLKKNIQAGKVNFILILFHFFLISVTSSVNALESLNGKFIEIKILDKVSSKTNLLKLKIGEEKIKSVPEQDVDRTSAEGKASSVQFIHFEFTDEQVKKFKDPSNEILIGVDHDMYSHTVKLTENNKKALSLDFS